MAKITNNNTKEINKMGIDLAVILSEMRTVKEDVKDVKEKLDKDYVTKTNSPLLRILPTV